MHLSEGVLQSSTLIIGAVCAAAGVAVGLKKLKNDRLSITALFSSVFFVASTIHVPVGIGSVHLILNGIAGIFLGWSIFPAFLIALILQAVLFSFGGFSVLGVNLVILALPAVFVSVIAKRMLANQSPTKMRLILLGILAGVIGIGGSALLASLVLAFDGNQQYGDLIALLLISHSPIFVVDSLISVGIVLTLAKMYPQIFERGLTSNHKI